MDQRQLNIFDNLDEQVDKLLAQFEKKIPDANKQILQDLYDFSAQLKKRTDGTLVPSVENLKLIDKYYSMNFDKVIGNSDYGTAVNKFVQQFKNNTGFINDYFSTVAVTFNDNKALYQQIIDTNIDLTTDKLIGSRVDANFSYPIKQLLKENVKNGTNTINLRKTLENHIIGTSDNPGALLRYSKQVASDSVHQYNRNYIQTISNDLGLKYYYYRGTKIADSRPFCASKAGKYFTEEQVKSWGHQKWAGMIAGTNEQNIKNCAWRLEL